MCWAPTRGREQLELLFVPTHRAELWQTSRDVHTILSCGCTKLLPKCPILVSDHMACNWFIIENKCCFYVKMWLYQLKSIVIGYLFTIICDRKKLSIKGTLLISIELLNICTILLAN